ncbi:MAG: patched family protein, partial [Proteobacteria bacterium]|nr:patched family protein [Pseudomonadota bacterium]
MKSLREKIERGFEKLGRGVIRFRWLVLVIVVLLTGVMISQLRFLKFDMATEAFLADDDPKILEYDEFRDQFGNSENILIMLQPSDVFNLDFLTKLKAFHEALEERLPYVKEVNSL